ncbi:MAG TPA: DUF4097 family beta strand repeat-containing protein [Vicinamibacterales bacterium]|jgi:DUF4097 and DUF4098 domain-containing protein YvlB|nr:DUF4097 family beta strand repeat-containing protein [Vicinamibacterales bacterium]
MNLRRDRSFVTGAAFALAVLALATVPLEARAAAEQDQTDRQTRVVSIGASGSLEIKNVSGDVTVTAGSGTDARIEFTKRARGKTAADVRRGLDEVTVDIEQQSGRVTVETHYPNRDRGRNDVNVDITFVITAPAGTRVTASTVSGNVRVENIKGNLSASTVSGDVALVGVGTVADAKTVSGSVKATDIAGNDSLSLTSVSGDILIDRVSARRLDGSTTSGNVTAMGITSERASLHSLSGNVSYSGALARSGRYELQSHSGDVTLNPSGTVGYELQASTFSGHITPGADMVVKSISPGPSNVRATVGDGSATVAITTFSGNVEIRKR